MAFSLVNALYKEILEVLKQKKQVFHGFV